MLFTLEQSSLVVIDMQGNLAEAMQEREMLYANVVRLIQAARILELPLTVTEQVPDKIGATVAAVHDVLPEGCAPVVKESFSCWRCEPFRARLNGGGRREIILCGIEAHVCVSQTALDLVGEGFRVACVADATGSRSAENKSYGLQRMAAAGVQIVSTEMIATELLKTSAHPKFKEILKLIK